VAAQKNRVASYGFACGAGLFLAFWLLPPGFLWPSTGLEWRPVGDAAQHIIAQRYFLADAWRWPPLLASSLGTPEGTNIAFADGIPLLALLLKPFAPPGFHGVGLWHAIVLAAQPAAAVWCLRAAGERRLLPAIGVALAALSTPAFLARHGHAALMGQFTLFLALGLALLAVRNPTFRNGAAGAGLAVATLLIHPYLALMVLALLASAPLTLALRRDPLWPVAALGLAASMLAMALVMAAFGYLGATGDPGFYGDFAMNLLSPAWPARSLLAPTLAEVTATGRSGWEGYNWLGVGLWAGLLLALLLRPRAMLAMLRAHPGLALAAMGLTALAVSTRVAAGPWLLLDLQAPAALDQFRASGRFFWPVSALLLIAAALLLARLKRVGPWLVLALGLAQFADAAPNRAALAEWSARREPWSFDAPALRRAFAEASRLTLVPSWPCIPREDWRLQERAQEVLALASETALPVNTMQVARWRGERRCTDAETLARPPAPGELRLWLTPPPGECRALGGVWLCGAAGEAARPG
jgi:hypothetical protein